MHYRWLSPDEIINVVNPKLKEKGWPLLNTACAQVLGAFDDQGELQEFLTLQLIPALGPLLRVDGQDAGETSRELASRMASIMIQNDTRGCITIAESPATQRLCERFKMKRIEDPVYLWSGVVV